MDNMDQLVVPDFIKETHQKDTKGNELFSGTPLEQKIIDIKRENLSSNIIFADRKIPTICFDTPDNNCDNITIAPKYNTPPSLVSRLLTDSVDQNGGGKKNYNKLYKKYKKKCDAKK